MPRLVMQIRSSQFGRGIRHKTGTGDWEERSIFSGGVYLYSWKWRDLTDRDTARVGSGEERSNRRGKEDRNTRGICALTLDVFSEVDIKFMTASFFCL